MKVWTAALARTAKAVAALIVASSFGLSTSSQTNTNQDARRRDFTARLVAAAIERTHHSVRYDSAYLKIPYPGGDVPADTGVCTDEIIRSYRAVGVDLQK